MLVYYWSSASLKNLKFYQKGREKDEEKRKKGRKEGIVSIVSLLNTRKFEISSKRMRKEGRKKERNHFDRFK